MTARSYPVEEIATVVERLAVLIAAGVAPASAWGYLGGAVPGPGGTEDAPGVAGHAASGRRAERVPRDRPARVDAPRTRAAHTGSERRAGGSRVLRRERPAGTAGVVRAVAAAVGGGDDPVGALVCAADRERAESARAWRAVAAALAVATESGAPVTGVLRHLAGTLRELGQTQRDIAAALAGPVSTARLVMALPVVGLCLGLVLGVDTVAVLASPIGAAAAITGVLLMIAGALWNAAMVRRARPTDPSPGLGIDLMAIAMSGGASVARAAEAARRAARLADASDDDGVVDEVLALAMAAGVPASDLLRSEAEHVRRAARSAGQMAAAALGTRLMIPLGLCVLPAFMLLGVAPLMIGIMSSTHLGL